MPGVFKKLNAQDVKITPFEAHKQYNTTNLPSIGAQTASLAWSGKNKSTFTTGSRQYYQIDKLYYRDYIGERAHRLELGDATYTTQERRLYESASLLSLSQKTFGSEVQPESFELSVVKDSKTFNIKDDGFGNLYDTSLGNTGFPNEDNRVFYLSPVQAFKRKDLTIDPVDGSAYVNIPYPVGFNGTFFDDSYIRNPITYHNIIFTGSLDTGSDASLHNFNLMGVGPINPDTTTSFIKIPHQPQLNFEQDEEFTISFYYHVSPLDWNASSLSNDYFIISKEGTKTVPTTPSDNNPSNLSSSLQFTTEPVGPQFPYRVFYKGNHPNNDTASIFFERSDGETTQFASASFFLSQSTDVQKHVRIDVQTSNITINVQGEVSSTGTSNSQLSPPIVKSPTNQADIYFYRKALPNGSFSSKMAPDTGKISQFMIWNKSLSDTEYANVSKSIVGTPNIGNIFYDNGFAVLTHPKYMELFNGGTLNTLKYKNTHLITENEYQCTVDENEFEFTTNITARKKGKSFENELANFATGSNFKPYITTIGLHDDNGNLLVVGKLAQPVKVSSETDTTFVIRYDT